MSADIDFLSSANVNPAVLDYQELKRVKISFYKMTFSLSFKIVNYDQKMLIRVKKVTLNGSGDNISIVCEQGSFFLQIGCTLFENSKYYLMQNVNTLLIDFLPTFNLLAELFSADFANYIIPFTMTEQPLMEANMQLINNENPEVTPNPIIFDNFFSSKFEGQVYPNSDYLEYSADDMQVSQNYLPLYFVESQDFQLYLSEMTYNQLLFADQYYSNFQYNSSTILGQNCSTALFDSIFGDFQQTFGTNLDCYTVIKALSPINVTITAGDVYVDPNYYQLLIYVNQTTPMTPQYRHVATIQFKIKEVILSTMMAQNFIQYYSLKNFNVSEIFLAESSVIGYNFDNVTLVNQTNTLYKDIIKTVVNTTGQEGIKVNTSSFFGEKYNLFWTQSLPTLEMIYKDSYYQFTTNFVFWNTTLFEDLAMYMFQKFNGTDFSNIIKEYDDLLFDKVGEVLNKQLLSKNVNLGERINEMKRKSTIYENFKQQISSDLHQINNYQVSGDENRYKRSRIKKLSVFQ